MTDKNDAIIEAARARFKEARDVEQVHIDRGVSDLIFANGEGQWPEEERRQRDLEGKPTLTFNRFPQFIRKVTGQIRNMNPAIKVSPADDSGTEDVAEVYEGLIREIEYRCDGTSIYEAAAESAAQCGIGHFRIRSEYCDEYSFNQHILLERIFNPFAVFYDPRAKEPTRSDAEFAFVIEEIGKERFKDEYPKAAIADFTQDHLSQHQMYWTKADNVVVAEYMWREYDEMEIAITPDGYVMKGPFPAGMEFSRKRTVKKPRVMWVKMTATEILEGPTRIPGKFIPVIAVTGEEIHIGEEVYRSGVVRFAKDAQISYNVMRTTAIETILLQPRAPYLVTAKQVQGVEAMWGKANTANRPYLVYNPDERAARPQRESPPLASQGLMQEAQIAVEDMKATIGIYDASLGARSNETSGIAIQSRQREAEVATSVYSDNMVKAVAHAGRVIVAMIPEIYDAERIVRVLNADDKEKMIAINTVVQSEEGPVTQNDMQSGAYSVRVSVGPTFASKRAEASDGMMSFLQAIPTAAPIIGDLVAGAQDWPDSDRIAARLKKAIPAQLLEDDEQDEEQDPQVMQQKMMAQQQAAQEQQQQAQMAQMMQESEVRKAVAEAEKATADAKRAQADARKADTDAQLSAFELNVAQRAPMLAMPGQRNF